MHVVGPRGGTCGHHIYQIYASYLHVRILYEFLGTFQSLKVFGKFKTNQNVFENLAVNLLYETVI